MSFTFGTFNTAEVEGITATLKAWPGPALKPETVELLDGAFYARTGHGPVVFDFDVRLAAATPAAVLALRDRLVAGVAPEVGLQALVPEAGEGWVWWAATSQVSEFTRGLWINGVECQLAGTVSFLVPDGVGWANPDDTASGSTSATITRTRGTWRSFPKLTVQGAFGGVRITAGSYALTVTVPVAAGQRLELDFQAMDFGVWQGTTKVAHAAPGMSRFDRLALPLGATTITAAATSGSVSSLTVAANSRRG
ncbi:MAG: hypothetical protein Q4F65_01100 [Propionibacteriaceae bacterium]|nr:hypothetical protein [Propionibacteriaceae bacterium]